MERLNKIIARFGICSRRAAEQLLLDGKVEVNGMVVTDVGGKADWGWIYGIFWYWGPYGLIAIEIMTS